MKVCMYFSSSMGVFREVDFIVLEQTSAGAGPQPANAAIASECSIFMES